MIAPVCPACDHIGHPAIVAGSRFLPGAFLYRPADADGPLFGTRKEAEEWVCARRQDGSTTGVSGSATGTIGETKRAPDRVLGGPQSRALDDYQGVAQ